MHIKIDIVLDRDVNMLFQIVPQKAFFVNSVKHDCRFITAQIVNGLYAKLLQTSIYSRNDYTVNTKLKQI